MRRMVIDAETASVGELYTLLISSVVPRPIAFVSTCAANGATNLAPFSFFSAVCYAPAMVSISMAKKRSGDERVKKDTLRNIEATGELVVNIATEALMTRLNQTSANYDYGVSEIDEIGFTPVPSDVVAPPRIAECPVSMECVLDRVIELGRGGATSLVIAEVRRFHVADAVWDEAHRDVDPNALRPLARLGRSLYGTLGPVHDVPRPK